MTPSNSIPRRDIHGIVVLDKPSGMTSNGALQRVKRLYQARKAGHTGSLDPLASGVLPVCLGEATKISGFLLDADKVYRVAVALGVRTATADADGEIIETTPVPALSEAVLRSVLAGFIGRTLQVPPMYSALKHQGQPLYRLARRGIDVARTPREIAIFRLELLRLVPGLIELEIHCSKGTYIRSLAEDIGAALGCAAHVKTLRRLKVGPFDETGAVTLGDLEALAGDGGVGALDARLQPMETAIGHWPGVQLSDEVAALVRQGQAVLVPRAPTHGWVRLFGQRSGFLGVGHILDDGRVAPKRLINNG